MEYGVAPCVPGVGGDYEGRKCCGTAIDDLHTLLKTQSHPSETAAIIIEPILGEGGFLVPPPGYLEELRKVCSDNDILLIFDEVCCDVVFEGDATYPHSFMSWIESFSFCLAVLSARISHILTGYMLVVRFTSPGPVRRGTYRDVVGPSGPDLGSTRHSCFCQRDRFRIPCCGSRHAT